VLDHRGRHGHGAVATVHFGFRVNEISSAALSLIVRRTERLRETL
jgi:hypothetical protein